MDPIEAILAKLFGLVAHVPTPTRGAIVVLGVGLALMVVAILRRNLLGGEDRAKMRVWSDMSAALNDRIAKLMPHYEVSMLMLAKKYGGALQGNKDVVRFIRSINPSVKEKAEIDFCLQDADKETNVAMLQSQLEALLKKGVSNG